MKTLNSFLVSVLIRTQPTQALNELDSTTTLLIGWRLRKSNMECVPKVLTCALNAIDLLLVNMSYNGIQLVEHRLWCKQLQGHRSIPKEHTY